MTTTDDRRLFVDTNILVYATNSASLWHRRASDALQEARQDGIELIVSQQIVREYMAVATRLRDTGGGLTTTEITENVTTFRAEFTVVDDTPTVLNNLVELVQQIAIGGRQIHDANIVATMRAHGVRRLLTHNTDDFARYHHLITVVPLEPLTPAPDADA